MAKRATRIFTTVLLILVFLLAFTACEKPEDDGGETVYTINSAADFEDIRNHLGAAGEKTVFNLESDIVLDGENWTPIGTGIENAFRGKLNGNGHTVTLSAGGYGGRKDIVTREFGIFGSVYGAEFENLNLSVNFYLNATEDLSYVGGLTGFSYGENLFKDITLSGVIDITPEYEEEYLPHIDSYSPVIERIVYIGGLTAYGTGRTEIDGYTGSLAVTAEEIPSWTYENQREPFGFYSVYAGAAAGYIRTTDISATNGNRHKIKDISVEPAYNINAYNIYSGGAAGIVYNADIENVTVNGSSKLITNANKHGYNGGAFGLLDNSVFKTGGINCEMEIAPLNSSSINTAYSIGGAAGYINNGSLLEDLEIQAVIKANIGWLAEAYFGGVSGTVSNARVKDVRVSGGFKAMQDKDTAYELFEIATGTAPVTVKNFAGAVGLLLGLSVIENAEVDFISYQGIVAVTLPNVIVQKEKIDDDEEEITVSLDAIAPGEAVINAVYIREKTGAYMYGLHGDGANDKLKPNGFGTPVAEPGE